MARRPAYVSALALLCVTKLKWVYAAVSPFSGDLLGDSRMSNVLDKSFIHRSYPKLAYGSINIVKKTITKLIT